MAALDILQTVTPTPVGATSMTITFSALTPGDIVLFFQVALGTSTTPPAGVQSYNTGGGGIPCRAFAKVVQSGDPLSWTFTTSTSGRQIWVAYRIEGPFTDLSTLQVSNRTGSASVTAFRIVGTDVTVNANTRVFAAITRNEQGAVTFSNGFATGGSNQFVESVATATRLYTTSATDVHTEATWATAAWPNAMLLRLQAQAAPPPTSALVIDTQPANSWNGQTIRPAVVVRMTTNGTTTDTAFTGNVVATRQTGTGTLGGTMTVAAVAGVATFSNLAITGSGAHTLRFTANALTVDSTSFNVATGTGVPGGGNLAYTEADMQQDVRALGAASQVGEVLILNTDGTPATGLAHNTAGLACNASTDGGAASPVSLAAMTLGGAYVSGGFVQINATTRPGWYAFGYPTFPSSGRIRSFTFTGTGLRPATVRVTMTAYDPTADNTQAQATATANEVQTRTIAAVTTVNGLAANAITAASIANGALTAATFAAGAFDAVWTAATRTLTGFGTLVADAATAVWAATTRTLSASGNTAVADVVQTRTIAAVTVVNSLAPNTVTASALAADAVQEIGQEMLLAMAMGRGNRLALSTDGTELILFGTDGTTELSRQPITRLPESANPPASVG